MKKLFTKISPSHIISREDRPFLPLPGGKEPNNNLLPPGGGGLRWGGLLAKSFLIGSGLAKKISPLPLRERVRVRGIFIKSVLIGSGLAVGIIASLALAVTVGTVKTWTTGETLTAADLNSTVTSLKTALEAIPNWTKSGTSAVYTDGNVGIGTATPGSLLEISSGTGNTVLGLSETATGGRKYQLLSTHDANADAGGGKFAIRDSGVAGSAGYRMVMTNAGYVGIGTTSPGTLLELSHATNPYLRFTRTTGNYVAHIDIDDNGGFNMIQDGATKLHFGTDNSVDMSIVSGGNVGIGTATPGYPLTMGSGAYVTTGGVWTNASSREYKENLEDLTAEEALAAVMALEPQKFNYKKDKGGCPSGMKPDATNRAGKATTESGRPRSPLRDEERADPRRGRLADPPSSAHDARPMTHDAEASPCAPDQYVGFIAEDVPDLVATNDRKGLSSMDLVAVLTKVVQDQQARMDEMQGEIETLKRVIVR